MTTWSELVLKYYTQLGAVGNRVMESTRKVRPIFDRLNVEMQVWIFFNAKFGDWFIPLFKSINNGSPWPRSLRRGSAAARLLGLWVRIPPEERVCLLSGRCPCDGLITRPEESYRLYCVVVCSLESPRIIKPGPALDHSAIGKRNYLALWQKLHSTRRRLFLPANWT